MNIWLSKKFIRVGSHTICQSLQKSLVSIDRKKYSKNTIVVLQNRSMTSWQVIHRGFTRMSPKVNSSRLYGCFKMSQIQQKLLAHEAFPSKWSPVFWKNGTCCNRTTRTTQNSQFWVVHNHICLPVVFPEIRKTNRRRWFTPYHDNASSHRLAQTTAFLSTQNIGLMRYPPYSPALAPNDFFLFPYIKNKRGGQRFLLPKEAFDAFRLHVLVIPQSEWQKCFYN